MITENNIKLRNVVMALVSELEDYYERKCDYSKGYLDGLFEICRRMGIKAERSELMLHIEEQSMYKDRHKEV